MAKANDRLRLTVSGVQVESGEDDYQLITMQTNRGDIICRYYEVDGSTRVVAFVPGAGGGWYSPAGNLYYRLIPALADAGIAAMQVLYRHPAVLEECTLDLLAGINYLESEGIASVGVVGHSFGGAVAVQAAATAEVVHTCVCLATQSYGIDPAATLAPRCSLLVVHGGRDTVLPVRCADYTYAIAGEPKRLQIYPAAGHSLNEVADELFELTYSWLTEWL